MLAKMGQGPAKWDEWDVRGTMALLGGQRCLEEYSQAQLARSC